VSGTARTKGTHPALLASVHTSDRYAVEPASSGGDPEEAGDLGRRKGQGDRVGPSARAKPADGEDSVNLASIGRHAAPGQTAG
jgi:hypothetical protein